MNRLNYKHQDIRRIFLELVKVKCCDETKELYQRAGILGFEITEPKYISHSPYYEDSRTFKLTTSRDLLICLDSTELSFHAPNDQEEMVLLESHSISSRPYISELADYLNDYFLQLDTEIAFFFSRLKEEKEKERKSIIYRILGDNLLCKKK